MTVIADRARRITGVLAAIALITTLSACASDDGGVSLADTKGPTQLLRNDAASRVPEETVLALGERKDQSVGCSLNDDADGLMRKWHSNITLEINSGFSADVESISTDLSKSYTEAGWDEFKSDGSDSSTRILQNAGSTQEFRITTTGDPDGDGLGANIVIDVFGACVKTGGPDSDEVKQLGDRG